jgi:hypothetical protein
MVGVARSQDGEPDSSYQSFLALDDASGNSSNDSDDEIELESEQVNSEQS